MLADLRFDPFDPAFVRDPYPVLRRFREEAPRYFWPQGQGFILFRYSDVMAALREPRLVTDPTVGAGFSAEQRAAFPDYVEVRENDLLMMKPEAHTRVRKLINPIFGPRAVEMHRPKIAAIIGAFVEALPSEGVINVFAQLARHYPVRVIAGLFNIPPGDETDFVAFADASIATIFPGLTPEQFAGYMPTISRGLAIIRDQIAERRTRPIEGDVLSGLIHACDEDERLSEGELLSLVSGLLVGGADTTVHLTTYTILELLRHPEQLALLREDPSLARLALDETLRYNAFGRGPGMVRFASERMEFEGVPLERGQPLFLNTMAALRDPEFVADGDVFEIRRRTNSSPWFGFGPHFCVGASLARLEAEMALQMFFARYPRVELAGEPVYGSHPILRDIVDLPVRVSTHV